IIPPKIAPHQVVIVPIFYGEEQSAVVTKAHELKEMLKKSGIRVKVDDRDEYTPGWKFSEWELRGVPLRLEIGPRDLASSEAVLVRRDTREKVKTSWEALPQLASDLLEALQRSLLERSKSYRESNTRESQDFAEFKNIIEEKRGFILSPWCGSEACEEEVKAQTTATIRCLKEEEPQGKKCLVCGKPAKHLAYFAKSY
ncbi:MAG: proline--tRNA ligase anticodon binding domain-containing protein, partial [bacterium]